MKILITHKYIVLFWLAIAELFGLSLWFSVNAVMPQIKEAFSLTSENVATINIAVILGFVVGGLISSFFSLSDIFSTRTVFMFSAIGGALSNGLLFVAGSLFWIILLRFLTGMFLAGIYPTGIKLATTWFQERLGFAVGVVLGALTLGSGTPYLFNLFGIPDWRIVLLFSSALSVIAAGIIWFFVHDGPHYRGVAAFKISNIKSIIANKALRLVYYGYCGHMWELYAMWVWMPFMLREVYVSSGQVGNPVVFFSLGSFGIFFVGALGAVVGGIIADRYGRIRFNILTAIISIIGAGIVSLVFPHLWLVLAVALVWGLFIIPDSPQYSSMVSELVEPKLVGTALTLQTAIGFLITIVSIQLMPYMVDCLGWGFGFLLLLIGPGISILHLVELAKMKESKKIR